MTGIARIKPNGDIWVEYSVTQYSKPVRVTMWWKAETIARNPYSPGFPADGDVLESSGDTAWNGRGYSLHFPGNTQAIEVREEEIPAPKVRKGTPTRYYCGRWEKATKREGWIPA